MSQEHICFISPDVYGYFDRERARAGGGQGRQVHLLAKELQQRGYRISFITADHGQPDPHTIDGFTFWKGCHKPVGLRHFPKRVGKLFSGLRKVDPDCYIINGTPTYSIVAYYYTRLVGTPLVQCVTGDSLVDPNQIQELHSNLRKQLDKFYIQSLQGCEQVIALTPNQEQIMKEEYGIKSKVIPCGYSSIDKTEWAPPEDRDYVLWVGRIDHIKQPEFFLELAERIPEEDFVMVGPPTNKKTDRYQKVISKDLELSNFTYEGYVDPDKVHEYYRNAKLLVNTSKAEGFGQVFLEAWRYGTPVGSLSFPLDGVIQDVGLFGNNDLDEFSQSVRSLCSDPRKIEQVGERGHSHFINNYSMNNVGRKYDDSLSELINN